MKISSRTFELLCQEIVEKFKKTTGIHQSSLFELWGYFTDHNEAEYTTIKSEAIKYFLEVTPKETIEKRAKLKAKLKQNKDGIFYCLDGKHFPDRRRQAKHHTTITINPEILEIYLRYAGDYLSWHEFENRQEQMLEFICYYWHPKEKRVLGFNVNTTATGTMEVFGTRTGAKFVSHDFKYDTPITFIDLVEQHPKSSRRILGIIHTSYISDLAKHDCIPGTIQMLDGLEGGIMNTVAVITKKHHIYNSNETISTNEPPKIPKEVRAIIEANQEYSFYIKNSKLLKISRDIMNVFKGKDDDPIIYG